MNRPDLDRGAPSAIAVVAPSARMGPAELYVASLGTETSRRTAMETLRRVTVILTGGSAPDDWRNVPWENLRARETTLLRTALIEQNAPSTARLSISMVKSVLKQAFRLGMIPAEEYQRAIMLDPIRGESAAAGRMLSEGEISALAAYLAALPSPRGPMVNALFAVALGGGLRREELAKLSVGALAQDDRHIRVMGKGRRERIQPIPAWVGAALRRWVDLRTRLELKAPTMFVHVRQRGLVDAPMNVQQLWELVVATGKAAECQPFSTHDLRRTFASRMFDKRDMALVQRLMAHKNPETTARYDRRGAGVAEEAVAELEGFGFEKVPVVQEEEKMTRREFVPETKVGAANPIGSLGEIAKRRLTSIQKAPPAVAGVEKEKPHETSSKGSRPATEAAGVVDEEAIPPAVLVEGDQTLVARPRRTAVVEYRRNGLPLDLVWIRSTCKALKKKGHTPEAIAKGLGDARGVTRGDGGAIGGKDVERWLR